MNYHYITHLGRKTERIEALKERPWLMKDSSDRKRIQVAGLGDVGSTLLIGLRLLGADVFESIGIYDLDEKRCERWEMELNQVREAFPEKEMPEVTVLSERKLFDCDIFVFCIARNVPAVGNESRDVRLVQLEANGKIVYNYAKEAAKKHFKGLFVVVSDPVDLLCNVALRASREEQYPLHPYQIQGCGLGVMNARATYYAKQDKKYESFLESGRAFGPHGDMLVIANSLDPDEYDDELSKELTRKTVTANLSMRAIGYKPYVAPSLSSGALTILKIVKGQWNYSAQYLNGIYFGAKNQTLADGVNWENKPIPQPVWERLEEACDWLHSF